MGAESVRSPGAIVRRGRMMVDALPPANARLVADLRDSSGYLADQGWHQTAIMMELAANELERLSAQVAELQCKVGRQEPRRSLS
jgi:hypothetical protein